MYINIDNISKSYILENNEEHIVLKDVNFTIDKGDFVVILGESGCGKSTLLNMLAGFDIPTSGSIYIDEKKIEKIHHSRSLIQQQPTLIPWLNMKENVAYGCRLRGDTENLDYRVQQFLEIMGIEKFSRARPDELSVGMAQRVCLARALVGRPDILLLDEPFASLDTFTQAHIQEEVVNLWLSEQFTAVFVTHDIDEAIRIGNKIVLLENAPATTREILHIDLEYPRDRHSNKFKTLHKTIIDRFRHSYQAKRGVF